MLFLTMQMSKKCWNGLDNNLFREALFALLGVTTPKIPTNPRDARKIAVAR